MRQLLCIKGYYCGVLLLLHFHKDYGIDSKECKVDVELYPDEEETEDVRLDDERGRHWKMIFEDNNRGVDDEKVFLHTKRWDLYMS